MKTAHVIFKNLAIWTAMGMVLYMLAALVMLMLFPVWESVEPFGQCMALSLGFMPICLFAGTMALETEPKATLHCWWEA